jgi:AcrR family transcriptional regulator
MMVLGERELLHRSERERLLGAMAELSAQRGFEEITVAEIVARAGSSERSFEKLFGDREGCLIAVENALLGEVVSVVGGAYSADRSEWDSGLLGIKAILELMAANPSFAFVAYIGARHLAPPAVAEIYRTGEQMLAAMIERLWEYSELDLQPRCAARAALGGCEAVVRAEVARGRAERLPRLLPDLVYAATVPFLGQEEAMRLARRAGASS